MYKIEAVIRPSRLEELTGALAAQGIYDFVVADVRGCGAEHARVEVYRGIEYQVPFQPKIKIELAVAADAIDTILDGIIDAAFTGKPGDGKIFVTPLVEVVAIDAARPSPDRRAEALAGPRFADAAHARTRSASAERSFPSTGNNSPKKLRLPSPRM